MKTFILAAVACASIMIMTNTAFAQEKKNEAKEQKVQVASVDKEVEGTISAVSPTGIAVVYKKDQAKGEEEEVFVPIEQGKVRLIHKKNLSEIGVGDTVKVLFSEVTEQVEDQQAKRLKISAITFLKKAEIKPVAQEEAQPEEEISQDEAPQTMPLKGMKEE